MVQEHRVVFFGINCSYPTMCSNSALVVLYSKLTASPAYSSCYLGYRPSIPITFSTWLIVFVNNLHPPARFLLQKLRVLYGEKVARTADKLPPVGWFFWFCHTRVPYRGPIFPNQQPPKTKDGKKMNRKHKKGHRPGLAGKRSKQSVFYGLFTECVSKSLCESGRNHRAPSSSSAFRRTIVG